VVAVNLNAKEISGVRFNKSGLYSATLEVGDNNGCRDTFIDTLEVLAHPIARIKAYDSVQCLSLNAFQLSARLSSAVKGSILQSTGYEWSFGSDATPLSKNGVDTISGLTYSTDSLKRIRLIVRDANGCRDTGFSILNVSDNPIAKVSLIGSGNQCYQTNSFGFDSKPSTAGSNSSSRTVKWTFDAKNNGKYASITSATTSSVSNVRFDSTGWFQVILEVTDISGCSDTVHQWVFVRPNPEAIWTTNQTSQCLNVNAYDFSAASSKAVQGSSIKSYLWKFGSFASAKDSTSANPKQVMFSVAGRRDITLTVNDSNGCSDTFTAKIELREFPKAVIASLGSNADRCLRGNTFDFDATNSAAVSSSTIKGYTWTFDATANVSQVTNANASNIQYRDIGTKLVRLKVDDNNGCSDTEQVYVRVLPHPDAKIDLATLGSQCFRGNVFTFRSKNSLAATLSSSIKGYDWSYTGTAVNPVVTNVDSLYGFEFNAVGVYKVTLKIQDANSCRDTTEVQVTVKDHPIARINVLDTIQCANGNAFNFGSYRSKAVSGSNLNKLQYQWQFGKDASPANRNAQDSVGNVTYSTDSIKLVRLIVADNNGCFDTTYQKIRIDENPIPKIVVNQDTQCFDGHQFRLSANLSKPGAFATIRKYTWILNGSQTSTVNDSLVTNLTYASIGTKKIVLKLENNNGCIDSIVYNIHIKPNPVADWNVNTANQCLNDNLFAFYSTQSKQVQNSTVVKYEWDFGTNASPATSDSASKLSVVYGSSGSKTVILKITDANGCTDTFNSAIFVRQSPIARLSIDSSVKCDRGHSFFLRGSNSSNVTGKKLKEYQWSLGDSRTSNGHLVSNIANVTYNGTGSYRVKLNVVDSNGCENSSERVIRISDHPLAAITSGGDTSLCFRGNKFSLNASNSKGVLSNSIKGYDWILDFGGTSSNPKISNAENISNIVYSSIGMKKVRLIVTDTNGCRDTVFRNIEVKEHPDAVIDVLSSATQCLNGNKFDFASNNSVGVTTKSIDRVYWTLGNSSIPTYSNNDTATNVVYTTYGRKTVQLIVFDKNGCSDTTERNVDVIDNPTASWTVSKDTFCNQTQRFRFSPVTTKAGFNQTIASYRWKFEPDGNPDTLTRYNNDSITVKFDTSGVKKVTIYAMNRNGCLDTFTQNVVVLPNPHAVWSSSSYIQCFQGNKFNFNSTGSMNTTGSSLVAYDWTFGTGAVPSTSNKITPDAVSYTGEGLKTVILKITDANGCSDTFKYEVRVKPNPTARFVFNAAGNNQCFRGHSFGVDAQRVGSGQSSSAVGGSSLDRYTWDFGAGASKRLDTGSQISTIKYASYGVRRVRLIVSDKNGCDDTTYQNITVKDHPLAVFTINDTSQCFRGNTFTYRPTGTKEVSGSSIKEYTWSFGANSSPASSLVKDPNNVSYNALGWKNVGLIVLDNNGCTDTIDRKIEVKGHPVAGFATNTTEQCYNTHSFDFNSTNNTVQYSKPVNQSKLIYYSWNFGKNAVPSTSVGSNIDKPNNIKYNDSGYKVVRLIVTDSNLCTDTIQNRIRVKDHPIAKIRVDNDTQCLVDNRFALSSLNTVPAHNSTVNKVSWNFDYQGSKTISTRTRDTVTYNTYGTRSIYLMVEDVNGCIDSVRYPIRVQEMPEANWVSNKPEDCLKGSSFNFESFNINKPSTSATGSNIVGVRWEFGEKAIPDTSRSTKVNRVTFASSGEKKVTLTVFDRNGCQDTFTSYVTVKKHPIAKWNTAYPNMCFQTNTFKFTADSSNAVFGSSIQSYTWSFAAATDKTANPAGATGNNPTNVVYSDTGRKRVSLIVVDANNCPDTVVGFVRVLPNPKAGWVVNDGNQCFDIQDFDFSNRSEAVVNSRLVTYDWKFGDFSNPISSTAVNPTNIVYTTHGSKTVTLTVTDSNQCKDTFTAKVLVREKPSAFWSVNQRSQCLNSQSYIFTSNGSLSVPQSSIVSYHWDFGKDASRATDSVAFPSSVTYSTHGIKRVRLTVTDFNGCSDTFESYIEVQPKPLPDFIINKDSQCLRQNQFVFTNNTKLAFGTMTYEWDFNDGSKRVLAEDTFHKFKKEGSYRVKLIARTDLGCRDSIDSLVVVNPMPIPDFTISSNCAQGNTIAFYNGSKIVSGSMSYLWDFGNGFTSTSLSPYFTYPNSGKYRVVLTVNSNYGCSDSLIDTIQVFTGLKAQIKVQRQQCGVSNRIPFTSTSYVPSGVTASYSWDFGDGKISNDTSPIHQYSVAGVYKIRLLISGSGGCLDSAFETVSVYENPNAGFFANDTCSLNGSVQFNNTSSINKDSLYYDWDFGDNRNSNIKAPSHKYNSYGSYKVRLIATSNHGCKDTAVQQLEIYAKPFATFATNDQIQCGSGNFFRFTNKTTLGSGSMKYYWSFGDGNTSIDTNPTHTYTNYGKYQVKLRAETTFGCFDTISVIVNVISKPTAGFTFNNVCFKDTNFFINTSIDTLPTTQYKWILEPTVLVNTRNSKHLFATDGNKNVCLVADNGIGSCLDTVCQTVEINPIPKPSFTASSYDQCGTNKAIVFNNTTSVKTGTYKSDWDFGDSLGSQLTNPSHRYGQPGSYQVRLKVTSDKGCTDSIGSLSTTIKISETPQVDFNVLDTCFGGTVTLENATYNDPSKWLRTAWDLGDGNISFVDSSFKHRYDSAGVYKVKLVVTLKNNCVDSFMKNLTIHPVPVVRILSNDSGVSACQSTNKFTFRDSSTIKGNANLSSVWTTSDGDTSRYATQSDLVKSFTQAGKYWIKLRSTSPRGCYKDDSTQVEIYAGPTADFLVNDSQQCLLGNNVEFRSKSFISKGGGKLTFSWKFGDDSTSTDSFVAKTYTKPGYYRVVLNVLSSYGCSATKVSFVKINDMPVANFTVNNANQCLSSNKFDFVNQSTSSTGNGTLRYLWEFSPTDTTSVMSPSRSYTASGRHLVNLRAITSFGCADDTLQYVEVLPNPDTPFVSVVNSIPCHGMTGKIEINRNLVAGGTAPYTYSWNNGSFTPSSEFDNASAGTYTVVIRDSKGCESKGTYYFSEPMPLVSRVVKDSNASCFGRSDGGASIDTIYGGISPYRFVWSKGSNRYFGKVLNRVNAGMYYVNVTDNNGCLTEDSVRIDEPFKIVPQIQVKVPIICFDSMATVQVNQVVGGTPYSLGNGYFYFWDLEKVNSGPVRSNLKAGIHTVEVLDSNSCNAVVNFELKQPEPINFTLDSSVDVRCFGELNGSAYVTVSGGKPKYQFQWMDKNGLALTGATKSSIIGVAAGDYQLSIKDAMGCPDTMKQLVKINQPAKLQLFNTINDPVNCKDGQDGRLTVKATGGNGGYVYKWIQTPNVIVDSTINNLKKDRYYLNVSDLLGCKIDTFFDVGERPFNPIVFARDSVNVCEGDSISFAGVVNESVSYKWLFTNNNFDYGWSNNPRLFLSDVNRNQTGYYALSGVDRYGCEADGRIFLRVDTNPILSVSSNPKIACLGSPVSLIANGAETYKWYRSRIFPTFGFDTLGYNRIYQIDTTKKSDTGIYYVMGTSQYGCSSIEGYRLKVGLDSIVVDGDKEICEGSVIQLMAEGGRKYEWTDPFGNIVIKPNFVKAVADSIDEGIYKVRITDKWDCVGEYELLLKVRNKPNLVIEDIKNGFYCDGDKIKLVANTDANSIDWFGPDGLNKKATTQFVLDDVIMNRLKQGDYKLIGYSTFGCIDSITKFVSVYRNPVAEFNMTARCKFPIQNEVFYLNSNSYLADSIAFYIDNEFISNQKSTPYILNDTGIMSVSLRAFNEIGCMDEVTKDFIIKQPDYIEVPEAFTPNNDLINNYLQPFATPSITNWEMKVYDRWGGKVFEGVNKAWDGNHINGEPAMMGVYVVIVNYSSICSDDETKLTNPPRFGVPEGSQIKKALILIR
jgi:gliding motility-associated-like protein